VKRVLVTGGSGFIGGYVTEELASKGYEVVVFDHIRRESPHEVFLGDIRDEVAVNEAVAHAEGVIHLGGVLGTQETIQNPRPAAHTNVLGGLNVLEACNEYDVPLVNIAVGNYWENNTYSITKNTVERFADMYAKYRGSRVSVVRALNAYGPRQVAAEPFGPSRVRKVMPSFVCRALSGLPIEIYGDGLQIMDMIYVADVARILVSALEKTEIGGALGTFEAGTGRRTTVNDIAQFVRDEVTLQGGPFADITHLPMRPGEGERSIVIGDPTTLELLNVGDLRPLEEGVKDTVAYFSDYLASR
jgi:UDP-glucose 4-epimerase